MRVTVVTHEPPVPPNRGGKLDIWRRLLALSECGVEVQLIYWCGRSEDKREASERDVMLKGVVRSVVEIPRSAGISGGLKAITRLLWQPASVATRPSGGRAWHEVREKVRTFMPDLVFLDGIYGGELARGIVRMEHVPLVIRSQNVEHRYVVSQRRAASSVATWLKFLVLGLNLQRYEAGILREAQHVFECSVDDLAFWRMRGLKNGTWLPFFAGTQTPDKQQAAPQYDVVFLGSLHTPSNVEGVRWLIAEVLPRLRRARPGATVLIAGSVPNGTVRKMCDNSSGVTLLADPEDAFAVYESGRVLVNPTIDGSGSSVKALDMLMTSLPIVSTPLGVRSMPEEVASLCRVAGGVQEFADAIGESLENPGVDMAQRASLVERHYGRAARQAFVAMLRDIALRGGVGSPVAGP